MNRRPIRTDPTRALEDRGRGSGDEGNGPRVEIVARQGTISLEMEAESSRAVVYFDDVRRDVELATPSDREAVALTEGEE